MLKLNRWCKKYCRQFAALTVAAAALTVWQVAYGDTAREPVVGRDTVISQTIYYRGCGESAKTHCKAAACEVGLTQSEFQNCYPGWDIIKFTAEAVEMSLQADDVCAEHKRHLFIGVHGQDIAVYYGSPGDRPVLKKLVGIKVSDIHNEAQLRELRQGVPVHSRREMLEFLEGLQAK